MPRIGPDGKTTIVEPLVYVGNGEYYPPTPNDALESYSFFIAGQPRTIDNHKPFEPTHYSTSPLALIVWGNLKRIDPAVDYIFTERLIANVIDILNKNSKVTLIRVFDERSRDIFNGITLNETHQGLLMHPYFAFRIEMTLRFKLFCNIPIVGVST